MDDDTLEAAVRTQLDQVIHLSLGTVGADGKPWVCELHFTPDDDLHLYFRSLRDRRHSSDLADRPAIAGTVVGPHGPKDVPYGVYFEGLAEIIEDADVKATVLEAMKARYWVPPDALERSEQPDGDRFYRVSVADFYVFGRIGDGPVTKHHLPWGSKQKG